MKTSSDALNNQDKRSLRRFVKIDNIASICKLINLLFSLQVCATNALELGVDVGSLDATLHLGYPGSVASLWQQSGRAGRRITERGSLSVYVGFGGPLDQYFMRDPQRLFGRPIENAQVKKLSRRVL